MTTEQLKLQGERIRIAREGRGWSQADLAREAGVSPNTVLSMEQGAKKPWGRNLRAVLDALDLAAADAVLELDGVPADVQTFIKIIANKVSAMDEASRERLLSKLYPQIIEVDETAAIIAQARRERLAELEAERGEGVQDSQRRA